MPGLRTAGFVGSAGSGFNATLLPIDVYALDSRTGYNSYFTDTPVYALQHALSQGSYDARTDDMFESVTSVTSSTTSINFHVWQDGCPSDGNCTELCLSNNTDSIFSSLHTLHNCIVLPNITTNNSLHNLTWKTDFLENDRGSVNPLKVSYQPADNTAQGNIIKTVATCLYDYCSSMSNECIKSSSSKQDVNAVNSMLGSFYDSHYGSQLVQIICDSVDQRVLSDIGGIGVRIQPLNID